MKNIGAQVMDTLKSGLVDGPTLYLSQKLVGAVDAAGKNLAGTVIPQELRTPLVGVALALGSELAFGGSGYPGKVSEYLLASAVAQTLALAGNGGSGMPGVLDTALNKALAPIANIGAAPALPSPTATSGYIQGARGYIQGSGNYPLNRGAGGRMAGYVSMHR
jgi:hypothetical protein